MEARFKSAAQHGFLSKLTLGWRHKLGGLTTSLAVQHSDYQKTTWVKSYYVLQRGSLYVYERDNYDKPLETVQLESYRLLPGASPVHNGRQWVLQVQRGEEQPVCLACEDG